RSTYHADLLVGADGVNSIVRQCIYRDIGSENLPKSDVESITYRNIGLVGSTGPLDLSVYPNLKNEFSNINVSCVVDYFVSRNQNFFFFFQLLLTVGFF